MNSIVEIPGLDQIEARKLLFGLRERPVRDRDLAVPQPHGRGSLDRLKRLGGNQDPAVSQPRSACEALAVGNGVELLFFEVDQAQVTSFVVLHRRSFRLNSGRPEHRLVDVTPESVSSRSVVAAAKSGPNHRTTRY